MGHQASGEDGFVSRLNPAFHPNEAKTSFNPRKLVGVGLLADAP
jgi:hypothetical protein